LSRRRDLYLITNNSHKKLKSMPLAGFEPAIPANERQQTYFLDRAGTPIKSVHLGTKMYATEK